MDPNKYKRGKNNLNIINKEIMVGTKKIIFDWRVPVTTVWHILRLRMEKWLPVWRVAANILNKQSRIADKGWSSSLGFGRSANNSSP